MTSVVSSIAGSVVGGLISKKGADKAAQVQENAAKSAEGLQLYTFEEQKRLQEPFRNAGLDAQNKLIELLGLAGAPGIAAPGADSPDFGYAMRDFNQQDLQKDIGANFGDFDTYNWQTDPGYNFRLGEGIKALDRSAAARGRLLSGNQLKAITQYGQDFASNEFGNVFNRFQTQRRNKTADYMDAFNRFQTNRANKLTPLQSLMGSSQTAANTVGSAASNYGSNVGNLRLEGANARASGYAGSANALNKTVGGITNAAVDYFERQ